MAVVLVLIALAMIAGGVAAIVQGVPIIFSERGWALVIAGAAVAGSGAVLAGIGIAVSVLRRIERELGRLRERVGRLDAAGPAPPSPVGLSASRDAPVGPAAGVNEPPSVSPPSPRKAAPAPVRDRAVAPDAIPASTVQARPAATAVAMPDGPGEPEHLAAAPAPNGSPPKSAEPADAAPQAPTVVGTYNSGGNRYVMFSDGSIEAETPNGQFRFNSLDELKAFIASGGEEAGAPPPP